jgi:hypothetical protein
MMDARTGYVIPQSVDEITALLRERMTDEGFPEVFCPYCDITFHEFPDDRFDAGDEVALAQHMDDAHTQAEDDMLYQALNELERGM